MSDDLPEGGFPGLSVQMWLLLLFEHLRSKHCLLWHHINSGTPDFRSQKLQLCGFIAQWLDHWSSKPGVVSSILTGARSEEHTSELQSHLNLVCRLLLEIGRAHLCPPDTLGCRLAPSAWQQNRHRA